MFTGLVEETGEILKVEEGPFLRVYIGARKVLEDLKVGDSVAVDGACLTAVAVKRRPPPRRRKALRASGAP